MRPVDCGLERNSAACTVEWLCDFVLPAFSQCEARPKCETRTALLSPGALAARHGNAVKHSTVCSSSAWGGLTRRTDRLQEEGPVLASRWSRPRKGLIELMLFQNYSLRYKADFSGMSQVQGRPVDEAHLPLPGRYITLAVRGQHLQRILMQGPFRQSQGDWTPTESSRNGQSSGRRIIAGLLCREKRYCECDVLASPVWLWHVFKVLRTSNLIFKAGVSRWKHRTPKERRDPSVSYTQTAPTGTMSILDMLCIHVSSESWCSGKKVSHFGSQGLTSYRCHLAFESGKDESDSFARGETHGKCDILIWCGPLGMQEKQVISKK